MKPNQYDFTKKEVPNASAEEITYMDLAIAGARLKGLTSNDLDNATCEELWNYIEIADSVIFAGGLELLFGVAFLPKEEILHPWRTEEEELRHNQQDPLPCHRDEL